MADYIETNGMLSSHVILAKKAGYKQSTKYKKKWENWCPNCEKSGKMKYNPKGTDEGELTCMSCSSDFDVVHGLEKLNKTHKKYGLKDAGGRRNSRDSIDKTVGDLDSSSAGGDSSDGEYTVTIGYDTNSPFQAYLEVKYSVYERISDKKNGKQLKKNKSIYIDWNAEVPESPTDPKKYEPQFANVNSDGEAVSISFITLEHHKHRTEVLDKILQAEGYNSKESKTKALTKYNYYINEIYLRYDPVKTWDDKGNTGTLYNETTDESTYKMLLYQLGFYTGEVINDKIIGVSGKTLLEALKTITEEAKYYTNMNYSEYREDDVLHFNSYEDLHKDKVADEFTDGLEGNLLGISNVNYNPSTDLINTDVVNYKNKIRNKTNAIETEYNYCARTSDLSSILTYGEFMNIESSDTATGYYDAKQLSQDNHEEHKDVEVTFTAKVVGLPSCHIHDTVLVNVTNYADGRLSGDGSIINNSHEVKSLTINVDVDNRPMVQTDVGCGDVDATLKVIKNLEKQRRKVVKKQLDINKPIMSGGDVNLWS